jgi:hypothetical protein
VENFIICTIRMIRSGSLNHVEVEVACNVQEERQETDTNL